MPLYANAVQLIRANLDALQRGERVRAVAIGTLTDGQLAAINQSRAARLKPLPPIVAEVLFVGRHTYESRCLRDGYTIDDVIDQIVGAMDQKAVFFNAPGGKTTIQNPNLREDRYGNKVNDRAVLNVWRDTRARNFFPSCRKATR